MQYIDKSKSQRLKCSIDNHIKYFSVLVSAVESSRLHLTKISRLQMGEYLCVATNGVNPSTSKKYRTKVQCKFIKSNSIY